MALSDSKPTRPSGVRYVRDGLPLVHAPLWKVLINSTLRFVQLPFTNKPWLITTVYNNSDYEYVTGYSFNRVLIHDK